ncbi:hypothetical protein ACIA7S_28540 [Streptomyces sp. NPDC051643]|uniref:hypothetical protein n=1 Tax=Streptomyces sp. NPDC051643 TaxID=3365665 RepID=UPI0037B710B0
MPAPAETITHTESRRTGRRAWLKALDNAAERGLLPGFNATTRAIVDVLETRMGFDTGHARYVIADIMERTGLGRTAVTEHVKLLRRAGWIAWVEHGSLRNALRGLGRPGYAKTATVYAATIPPVYDEAMGHVRIGSGYKARVRAQRPVSPVDTAVDSAVETPSTSAVDNSGTGSSRTPSLWVDKEEGQVKVVGGKATATASAAVPKIRRKRKLTVTGFKITAERIQKARQYAVSMRPLVNWLQGASHDELSWVLLDLVAREWTESQILLWLHKLGQDAGGARKRPRAPHRVIAAALRRKDKADATRAVPADLEAEEYERPAAPNAAFAAARESIRGRQEPIVDYPTVDEAPELTWELAEQREAAKADPALIQSYARIAGRDEALRVYGTAAAVVLEAAVLVTA